MTAPRYAHGTIACTALYAGDVARQCDFYAALLGWCIERGDERTCAFADGELAALILPRAARGWLPCIAIAGRDVRAAGRSAEGQCGIDAGRDLRPAASSADGQCDTDDDRDVRPAGRSAEGRCGTDAGRYVRAAGRTAEGWCDTDDDRDVRVAGRRGSDDGRDLRPAGSSAEGRCDTDAGGASGELVELVELVDPLGGRALVWDGRPITAAHRLNAAGGLAWNEVWTPEPARTIDFYRGAIGWNLKTHGDYAMFAGRDRPSWTHAGICALADGSSAYWLSYFEVADCAAAVERASELGAAIAQLAMRVPGVGWMATARDPEGTAFGFMQSESRSGA